jgi:glycine/D-amino acid oxidase-like deaminating enzyme
VPLTEKHRVVVCGAGIAGISAAYHLTQASMQDILLVDRLAPLSLTSDHSTECYRNWWPDPELAALMDRSIDLMERLADESNNAIRMNRRGYLYASGDEKAAKELEQAAEGISEATGWPLRVHTSASEYAPSPGEGYHGQPQGADLLLGASVIRRHFPCLTGSVTAALHVRKAGWISAQQLGMLLLERARAAGVTFKSAAVIDARMVGTHIHSVQLDSGEKIECEVFIDAAGPYFKQVGALCGVEVPVAAELHLKLAFEDPRGVVPRDAPLLVWNDPVQVPWEQDEHEMLSRDPGTRSLTELMPGGAHTRPEGGHDSHSVLMLWDYRARIMEPVFPPPLDDEYPEIVLRGLSIMLPGLREYFGRAARPRLDGGYYIKTRENRLLVGPTPTDGVFVLGGVSGYGIMSACAAGELLAAHVAGLPLPSYAKAFELARYDDPDYFARLGGLADGEL